MDFWRIIPVDKDKMRLLLYAEMKLPGEAWLEFKIQREGTIWKFYQTATFRPSSISGRLYWIDFSDLEFLICEFAIFRLNSITYVNLILEKWL